MLEFKAEFEYGDRLYEAPESSEYELSSVNVEVVGVKVVLVKEITKLKHYYQNLNMNKPNFSFSEYLI